MQVLPVFLVRCLLFVMGSLSWVLRSHCAYNYQHFIETIELTRRQQHTRKSKINRKPRHISSDSRDVLAVIHCLKLKQKLVTVINLSLLWTLNKGELINVTQF